MLAMIPERYADDVYRSVPWLTDYMCWQNEEPSKPYHLMSTSHITLNERSQWASLGREIYDRSLVEIHADMVATVLDSHALDSFLIQHECGPRKWIPPGCQLHASAPHVADFLDKCTSEKQSTETEGLLQVEHETSLTMSSLLDYAFLLKYMQLDMLSTQIELVVKLTHHLDVQFISTSRELLVDFMESPALAACRNVRLVSRQ